MRKWLFAGGAFCIAFLVLAVYQKTVVDHTAPVITYEGNLAYSKDLTDADLLKNVSAIDKKDGDVSDSLIVESCTVDEQAGYAIVTYVARDHKNNIVKVSRMLPYGENVAENTEEDETDESLSGMAETISGKTAANQSERASASGKDGESELEDDDKAGIYTPMEIEIGIETESESETETESEELVPGAPVIRLNEKETSVQVGDGFNPINFIASIEDDYDNTYSLWRDIQIEGDYDTDKAGTYHLVFYVNDSSGNRSNDARFTLKVEENN